MAKLLTHLNSNMKNKWYFNHFTNSQTLIVSQLLHAKTEKVNRLDDIVITA